MFYIQMIHNDNAQVSFMFIEVCQPEGFARIFSKSPRKQNQTTLLLNLSLPLTFASEICQRHAILRL